MLKIILVVFSVVAAAYGTGHLSFLECPNQIKLPKFGELDVNSMGNLLRALTGRSIKEPVKLDIELPPFDLAKNMCVIKIRGNEGIKEINDVTSKTFTPVSEIEINGVENFDESITNVFGEESSLVTINLNDGIKAALLPLQKYCPSLKPDKVVKNEKNVVLNAITILSLLSKTKCNMPTFLEININLNSDDVKSRDDIYKKLAISAGELKAKYETGIFAIYTSNNELLKRSRRAADEPPKNDLNLAESYSEDYPVIFNIILWFGIVIVFSMLAISYTIACMDPGRDSIIYRMTSTRIKKDN